MKKMMTAEMLAAMSPKRRTAAFQKLTPEQREEVFVDGKLQGETKTWEGACELYETVRGLR